MVKDVILQLDGFATSLEVQIALSIVVAVLAFGGAYLLSRGRRAISDRLADDDQFLPIAIDVIGAMFTVGIVVAAVAAVAVIWNEYEQLRALFGVENAQQRIAQVAVTIVVLIAIQVFASVARRLLDDITRESGAVSEHERELTFRIVQILLWVTGAIVVLGVWEINLGGLLVGAGFLGIVLGLAAQQTLGALLAGLLLMFSRPFEVGDWVAVGEDEGIVTDVTMMNTVIQAFDGEYVVVPNDVISSQTVKNRSRKGRLRIEVDVGVDYTSDVEHARTVAAEAVSELDIVMDVPRPECVTKAFDESAVTLGVRGWLEHPSSRRRWRARTQMIRAVKSRFAEEGIKIPYPQRELSGREERGGLRLADEQSVARAEGEQHAAGRSESSNAGDDPEADEDSDLADDPRAGADGEPTSGRASDAGDDA